MENNQLHEKRSYEVHVENTNDYLENKYVPHQWWIYFGDPNTHAGNLIFASGLSGSFTKTSWHWPINVVLAILALPGDKTFKMSDEGASKITVDSGLIEYDYIIPAQTK